MADTEGQRRWKPGEQILQQDLWLGKLIGSRPQTVIEDRPTLLVLYSHPYAPYMTAAMGGRRRLLSLEETVTRMMSSDLPPFEERNSGRNHVLTLTPPESRHSVWLFWGEDWQFECWYVNLQAPIRRTVKGVLVQDQVLDIRVEPDGTWKWKDEDEFTLMYQRGFFTDEEASIIRAEGERMIQKIESRASPFGDGWEQWRPFSEWSKLQIPPDWDVLD
jgi:hypothetical protein